MSIARNAGYAGVSRQRAFRPDQINQAQRIRPQHCADEKILLCQFSDLQRSTVRCKCEGITTEQALIPLVGSSPNTTIFGIVKHLASVERWWFTMVHAGMDLPSPFDDNDYDFEFKPAAGETIEDVVHLYAQECERSRFVTAHAELDQPAARDGFDHSLRWVLLHMIEETSRHLGHIDLLREAIDGSKGE